MWSLLSAILLQCATPVEDPPSLETPAPATSTAEVEDLKKRLSILEKQVAEQKKTDDEKSEYWKNIFSSFSTEGFVQSTSDGSSKIRLGGSVNLDSTWYSAPSQLNQDLNYPLQSGVSLRRAVIELEGTLWNSIEFAFKADLAQSTDLQKSPNNPQPNVFFTDNWIGSTDLFVPGRIRFGHQKNPLTFEAATSSKNIPFMENSAAYDALNDNFIYLTGISYGNSWWEDRLTLYVDVAKPGSRTSVFSVSSDGKVAVLGRLHGFPIYNEEEQYWLYLGGGYSAGGQINDQASVYARPLIRSGSSFQTPFLVNTGNLFSESSNQAFGVGGFAAWGRFALGSEYLGSYLPNAYQNGLPGTVNSLALGNLYGQGFYVEALYFLTPDHHPADKIAGGLGRVKPVSPLRPLREDTGSGSGLGAWELAARYDRLDSGRNYPGWGSMTSWTAGVNWYWNANARMMFNYVYTQLDDRTSVNGSMQALGIRFAIDF